MKKLILALMLVFSTLLGGCASTGGQAVIGAALGAGLGYLADGERGAAIGAAAGGIAGFTRGYQQNLQNENYAQWKGQGTPQRHSGGRTSGSSQEELKRRWEAQDNRQTVYRN